MPRRKPTPPPPQQARSRESFRRMLDAAELVLEKHGVEGTTLARVARQARITPSNVYRRFRNKDALMAAVFDRFTDINARELETPVDTGQIASLGIRRFAEQCISGMIQGFRTRTGLIRAAVSYSHQHPTAEFVRRKEAVEIQLFRRTVSLCLLWRDEIRHSNPEYAVSYAFVMIALVLRELIIFGHAPMFEKLVPVDDEHLRQELPRLFLSYLGVGDRPTPVV
jgi:AcrR family transcriptional regulator